MIKNTSGVTNVVGASKITIGRFTYGFELMKIREWGEGAALIIGAFCSLAPNVQFFLGGNHRTDWITTFPFGRVYQEELGGTEISGHPKTRGNINIGNDVWIGSSATIMSGITIGDGAVIAANSTVVRNVGPYEIVGGNPATHIKYRFDETVIDLLLKLRWWDLQVEEIRSIAGQLSAVPSIEGLKLLIQKYRPDESLTEGASS